MNLPIHRIALMFAKIPIWVRQHRVGVVSVLVVITLILVLGIGRMKIDMTMDSFFQKKEPIKQAYDQFRLTFGSDEQVYLVYQALDGDVLSEPSLQALKGIWEELENAAFEENSSPNSPLQHITKVTTLINVNYLENNAEIALRSREFIGEQLPKSEAEREQLRQQALAHPEYPGLYVSEDFQYGSILIKTDFNASLLEEAMQSDSAEFEMTEMKDYALFMNALQELIQQEKYAKSLKFYPVGNPVLMGFAYETMAKESGMLMIGLLLLIIGVLWLLFRSFSAVCWSALIVLLSLVWVMGVIGWSGLPMSQLLEIIVFLVLAVGIADAIHILSGYTFFRKQGMTHEDTLKAVYQKSGLACFLTSVTTASGLMALTVVPIVPIQNFGFFAALGILFAFVFTIFLLPLLLDIWNPFIKSNQPQCPSSLFLWLQTGLQTIEHMSSHYPKRVFGGFIVVSLLLGIGAVNIQVDTNLIESIEETAPIREAYQLVDATMGGTGNIEILIDTGAIDGMKALPLLKAMEDLQQHLETHYPLQIVKTYSLVNVIKDSFKTINENKDTFYRIPQNSQVLAQTLFLFESADPEERSQLVTEDYQTGRLGISTINLGSQESLTLVAQLQNELDQRFALLKTSLPKLSWNITGQMPLMNRLSNYISWSQISSFGLTLAVISILFLVVFGSFQTGMLALLPNLFPMVVLFGLIGHLGIPLEMHLMLVAPITIGIAVDDTIHFLTHYRLEMAEHGDREQAIRSSFYKVGRALFFTTIILSVGFLIFLISSSKGFVYFGMFSAFSLFAALMADLVLLPAMIRLFWKDSPIETEQQNLSNER